MFPALIQRINVVWVVKPIIPHRVAVLDRYVLQKAIEELTVSELHRLVAAVTVVLVAEPDVVFIHAEDTAVGDGATLDVTGEIGGHAVAVVVLTQQTDVPLHFYEPGQQPVQIIRSLAVRQPKQALVEGLGDEGDHLFLVERSDRSDGKEVSKSGLFPVTIGIKSAAGNQTVSVWVQDQCPAPGVQRTDQARLGAEVAFIAE